MTYSLRAPVLTDEDVQALEFGAFELYNIEFHSLLSLSSARPVPVQVELDGTQWSVKSSSSHDIVPGSQVGSPLGLRVGVVVTLTRHAVQQEARNWVLG